MNLQPFSINSDWKHPLCRVMLLFSLRAATARGQRWLQVFLLKHVAVWLLLSLSVGAQAADQTVNKSWRSVAIKGYDAVAYFTMSKAVEGTPRFEHRWNDARWRFMSEEHLEMFVENPEKYAPRFGGYCAEGMAIGRKASIDPHAWLIVDGELYLNYSVDVRDEMVLNPEEAIEKADRIWEKLQSLKKSR